MKLKRITLFLMILLPVMSYAQKTWTLEDASGKINVNIILDKDIRYQITHEGDIMIDFSPISLTLTDGRTLGEKPRLKNAKRRTVNETIHPIVYKKATIEDEYNELTLNFRGGYSVVFRAYRDGVAYRFTTNLKDSLFVANEQAVFNLPDNPQIYAATPAGRKVDGKECQYFSAFQNTYLQSLEQLAAIRRLPITFTDIRPGFVATALLGQSPRYPMLMAPDAVARRAVKAVLSRRHKVVIDWRWAVLTALWRLIPDCLWRHLRIH